MAMRLCDINFTDKKNGNKNNKTDNPTTAGTSFTTEILRMIMITI